MTAAGPGQPETAKDDAYLPRVAKGAVINFSGAFVRMLLLYGYTFLLARLLSASDLGTYFLMFTIINILGFASMLGMDLGIVRYVALHVGQGRNSEARAATRRAFVVGVSASLVIMLALYVLAPPLSELFFDGSDTVVTGLRIFALAIPLWAVATLANSVTQGLHLMRYRVYSRDMGEQVSKIAFSVLLLALGAGLIGVIWANVIALAVAAAMSIAYMVLTFPRGGDTGAPGGPRESIIRYSLPLAFSNVIGIVLLWTDMLMMGALGTTEEAGYYGTALRVGVTGSVAILTGFRTVFAPVISDLHTRRRFDELQMLFKTVTRWILILSMPLLLILILYAAPVMRIFGADFTAGSEALALLAVGQLVNAGTGLVGLMVIMSGRSKLEIINVLVALAVNLILCTLLIPSYGVTGAAFANMSAVLVINIMRAIEVWVIMDMNAYNRTYIRPLAIAAAGATLVLAARGLLGTGSELVMVLAAVFFLIFYAVGILKFGLNDQDREVMGLIRGRLKAGIA